MAARLLIDCDPGFDDAIAILLAAGNPDVEVVGITTVAGNHTLDKVTLNARRVATVAGLHAKGVPIAAGAEGPLMRDQFTAAHIHGESGMDGPPPVEPAPLDPRHAVDLIIETVLAQPGQITLVPTGPLTNIALAVKREPSIVQAVAGITLMGGAFTRGNITPTSEFNVLVDPEAADIVFRAGWRITMVGLELTAQARLTPEAKGRLDSVTTEAGRFVRDLLDAYAVRMEALGREPAATMHDACAVAYAIDPTIMDGESAFVAVETHGRWSYGQTVTDFQGRLGEPNAFVPTTLDADRFWDMLVESVSAIGTTTGNGAT